MTPRRWQSIVLGLLSLAAAGCTSWTAVDYPEVSGRRVQTASVDARGAFPLRVGAYELVFADDHRAALLVELSGGRGYAHGFVEWRRPGQGPRTYVAGGWARQSKVEGQLVTVFDLGLNHLDAEGRRASAASSDQPPLAVRVVVHEISGAATLKARR